MVRLLGVDRLIGSTAYFLDVSQLQYLVAKA